MASLFEMITFVDSGDVVIRMHLFELLATIMVLLNVWLYGRLSIWGPRLGVVGCGCVGLCLCLCAGHEASSGQQGAQAKSVTCFCETHSLTFRQTTQAL